MRRKTSSYDVVVCGGGTAGFSAAVAAARTGAKTCLIHDRPVLGGNSSSEVRVAPQGAATHHAYGRETGIISEVLIEDRATNHEGYIENGGMNSVWDLVLYNKAITTPNLTLHVNTSVVDVILDDGTSGAALNEAHAEPSLEFGYAHRAACNPSRRIAAVLARVANAELELRIEGKTFIDCSGDSIVAHLAGCEWRLGTESREEFGELHASARASTDTMGSSIHFATKNAGRPVPFTPPAWAVSYDDASFFYQQGRIPWDPRGGFWWIEIGVPWHTIHDAEDIRHELTRHALGVWDWIKNKDERLQAEAANFSLDWIGQVPGKRESRRIMGRLLMTENDIGQVFPDEAAYGGWFLDLHTPGGLLAEHSEKAAAGDADYAAKSYIAPYGIPLRILIAKDIDNLLMAGRNVSVTKAVLGTVRVMCTTAVMGQAAGTAAALALDAGLPVAEFGDSRPGVLQQQLLRDGCFLPNCANEDPLDLARSARVAASSEALLHGAGPTSVTELGGIGSWYARDEKDLFTPPEREPLTARRGQWIAIGRPELEVVEVCLSNHSGATQSIAVELLPVDSIWDYRVAAAPLATGELAVPPGEKVWVRWEPRLTNLTPGRYVRLDLAANPEVDWHTSPALLPGCMSAAAMNGEKMKRYGASHTLSFRVAPPQPCYGPANVLHSPARPHRFTNLWRSDPAEPLDQWLQLSWDQPQVIARVHLAFPGHLLRQFCAYPPLYRDPQCPSTYSLQIADGAGWSTVARVTDNYETRRVHQLERPISTDRLRVLFHETNGDPSAALYEIRCYA